ncbi:uncharacterized protein MELLADRAFT_68032 [Melampsora larici-populina 98AG31]|uniref:Uncharacterized protein n=1 Tax=Melampsora larici-populina (strain 98AG31 / pathotype 3-4-7) TaxID=747676 RepID=F4S5B6_MELLP|nr:uncharacterized protein MELLADRAFT_68032 [Melampsora larici-populina 98AG31]EGG00138.1 hypothetical protein MELLADRAFT_68032 [Melampsora larici-populina 98AG31]
MDMARRDQIIAAKEKLHQYKLAAEEVEERKKAQARRQEAQAEEVAQAKATLVYHQNKAKLEAEREKARKEARAKEEEEYLRQHNKTVKQVLSQTAKGEMNDSGVDDEDEESEEVESSQEGSEAPSQNPDKKDESPGEDLREKGGKEGNSPLRNSSHPTAAEWACKPVVHVGTGPRAA